MREMRQPGRGLFICGKKKKKKKGLGLNSEEMTLCKRQRGVFRQYWVKLTRDKRKTKRVWCPKTRRMCQGYENGHQDQKLLWDQAKWDLKNRPLGQLGAWPLFLSTRCSFHLQCSLFLFVLEFYWTLSPLSRCFWNVPLLWSFLPAKLFPCCSFTASVAYLSIFTGDLEFICVPWQR